nr:3-dehydroquinate synthase [Bacteroidota bacterium]
TDLGGFVACTYQRGIEFINIPTSLLAMVDAAVGGKNGVDLGSLKNQIGIIRNPKAVLVDTAFLNTLPDNEFVSGQAEMIKHGLIHSEDYLSKSLSLDKTNPNEVATVVWESICIKNEVVTQDPEEKGLRKTLNYGHTLGHAIESYCLESEDKKTLLHGEAVAIGMILATFISSKLYGFPSQKLKNLTTNLLDLFQKTDFDKEDIEAIIKLLVFDKKNMNGKIQFVLLQDVGIHKINCIVENSLIHEAFHFYKNS